MLPLKFKPEEADFIVHHSTSNAKYVYTFKIVGEMHFVYFTDHFDKDHFAEIIIRDGKLFFRHEGESQFRQENKDHTPDLIRAITVNYSLIKDVLDG